MCAVVKKIPYFSENCDYDRCPHKMIVALFLRIMIMIAVLIKCTIYENRDHGRSLHKNIIFLSLYVIAIMISVLFISTMTIITVFTKTVLYLSLMKTTSRITFQKEDCDHSRNVAVLTKCTIFEFL